ncbi:MAG: glycosyl transferase [Hyphomicrobiales bacterium]|nr:glycosyl transferase [Hyphomicrobiales bacterium]
MSTSPIKVFIGSGEQSLLERKVLMYSLKYHTESPLDIYVFNGTHNSIERNDDPPFLAPMSLRVKYANQTEFSLYRYLIPELCQHQGRAIYLDSDMVCLGDIAELEETALSGCDFLARPGAFGHSKTETWGLSAMLIDCGKCRFNLEQIYDEIDQGLYDYQDFARMSPVFRGYHHYNIGDLDPIWNTFDQHTDETKIIHYTNLYSQPWKYYDHPYGELWFEYLDRARQAGYVTDQDIKMSIIRGYARPDLLKGNTVRKPKSTLKKRLKRIYKRLSLHSP